MGAYRESRRQPTPCAETHYHEGGDPRPVALRAVRVCVCRSETRAIARQRIALFVVGPALDRALPYLAIESFAWTSFVRHSLQYRRRRDGYRNLAATVARARFSSVRPNGDFEYYERMTHYLEAGRYDLVEGGALEPETDTSTYNGAVWLLARRTYWADPSVTPASSSPEWMRAIGFYEARAYGQLYRWSWTNAPQEYESFLGLIGASNDANRLAMLDLGVVIANHVLSTVDAYVTLRLRNDPHRREFAIEGQLPLPRVHR